MCHKEETNTFLEILQNYVAPVVIGFISYVITAKLDEWKSRKKQSKLGESIMDSLIEEVTSGINVLTKFNNDKELPKTFLPTKSWSGLSTISDDILLRIIEVSENVTPDHFSPKEIRIHCKNYFEMIAGQWNANINSLKDNANPLVVINTADELVNQRRYLEASIGVLKMLKQTKYLLYQNTERIFPK